MYTSGQENRGLISTALHGTGAIGVGSVMAYGGYKLAYGGDSTAALNVAKKIAKGFM